jgi:hypothetical protein
MSNISAQSLVINDECIYAEFIPDVINYCSPDNALNNVGAKPSSTEPRPICWPSGVNNTNLSKDVWYSFKPKNLGAIIRLTGRGPRNEGTILNPEIAIYSGTCTSLTQIACNSVLTGENFIEATLTNLTIGQLYYIRIGARDGNVGSFKMCINTFFPPKNPESDCSKATILCSKDPFFIQFLSGVGSDRNEVAGACIQEESASVWYKWRIKTSGKLTFTLTPNNGSDDLDFAVYLLPGGPDDCVNKRIVRCVAAGETIGASVAFNAPCFGPTGLSEKSTDITEQPGCNNGNDNFVSAIDVKEGEVYTLVVNNFSQSGNGFAIKFGGTSTFEGPEADFEINATQAFECDKRINIESNAKAGIDPIVKYSWAFGAGSTPGLATIAGPHQVLYNSFGNKTAALTVETSRGCTVTKTLDFFVQACCSDTSTLSAMSSVFKPISCFGFKDGIVEITGISGTGVYEYSLDNNRFQSNPFFQNFGVGNYKLYARDGKGCVDSTTVNVAEPLKITVDAGPDQTIGLGSTTTINASVSPPGVPFKWSFTSTCDNLLDSSLLNQTVFPKGQVTYILSAGLNSNCGDIDTLVITTTTENQLFTPNIIKLGSLNNTRFTVFGNEELGNINYLRIFDRWGNKMYSKENLTLNNPQEGWDGIYNGRKVTDGVYTWIAEIEYIDCTTNLIKGTITVVE